MVESEKRKGVGARLWDAKRFSGAGMGGKGMEKRPHIIIINPDEMRWDTMGHMGNRAAHTPALDAFAVHDAVSFDHAYCQNPVCVPSRCSFFTGLYPHTRGHRTMKYLLHEGETSLFQQLKEAGYYVWLNGRNDLIAGQITGLENEHADEIYYYDRTKEPQRVDPTMVAKMFGARKAGDSDTGKGAAIRPAGETGTEKSDENYVYDHYDGVTADHTQGMDNDWNDTLAAIDRIRHPADPDKPLCLFLGWTNPHPPYAVEQKFYDMIDESRIADEISVENLRGKSKMLEKLREFSNLDGKSREEWRQLRRVYLAQCAKVDAMFGAVCDALKEQGMYDDAAIFFLSDHGDFAGDYHLAEKSQNTFEDVLTRVPLLIKPPKIRDENGRELYPCDPGIAGGVVELVDFFATAMEYAGVEAREDHFGRSLQPMIADRSLSVRAYAHCEGGRRPGEEQCDEWHSEPPMPGKDPYWAKKTAQLDDEAHIKGTMVTDGHFKFVQRLNGEHELYCMDEDPYEENNLYVTAERQADGTFSDAALQQVMRRMQAELLTWYQETCDVVPREYDQRFSEERVWAMLRSLVPAELEQTVREHIRKEHPGVADLFPYVLGFLMKQE